ncbi:MAG: phosphotransferase [Patescibacteria group bacterium]
MTARQALGHYAVGKVKRLERITSGLIHASYKVETSTGLYLLQQLHRDLTHPSLTADYQAVTAHLQKKGLLTQTVVKTARGSLRVKDSHSAWRLLTFVPGRVYDGPPTSSQARRLGEALGHFHLALKDFRYTFKSKFKLHQWRAVHKKLSQLKLMLPEAQFLGGEFPKTFLPADLPKRPIHSDPKISNIVFGTKGKMAMIDLDTCQRHTPLVDLGDALRSWCKTDIRCFRAALEGYARSSGGYLSKREQGYIVQVFKLITLELAARFLIDVSENYYFGWDPKKFKSRREHNLARCRKLIVLYNQIVAREERLQKSVKDIFKR